MRRRLLVQAMTVTLLVGAAIAAVTTTAGAGDGAPVVQATISKIVLGTDPGVAFPITLICDSEGGGTPPLRAFDFQIPNNGQNSEVVNLRDGESTTVNVMLPPAEPNVATCHVTEDLTGLTLPAGITCTPTVISDPVVVYDSAPHDAEFTVTNVCAAPSVPVVEALATTTG